MSATPKLVTIFGGSGFLGRYIARRMAKQGWRVRVAVRRPNEAIFVRPFGVVGQVEPVLANIRDEVSTSAAIAGADVVVNCVGTFDCFGKNNFQSVQAEGADRIARLSAQHGVSRFVHVSAIGADVESESIYCQTKAEGENLVRKAFKGAVILRPSIIFGNEDNFFNRFATMAKFSPVVPIVGGNSKFQPVYVDDVAKAAEKAILGNVKAGVYELGGPDVETFKQLISRMLTVIRRKRLVLDVPVFVARIKASMLDIVERISGGLLKNVIFDSRSSAQPFNR